MSIKFIAIPLIILFSISVFGFLLQQNVPEAYGNGALTYNGDNPLDEGDPSGWYTGTISGGVVTVTHHVMYGNGSCVDDAGTVANIQHTGSNGPWNLILRWTNTTGTYAVYNSAGEAGIEGSATLNQPWFYTGSLMLLGIIGGLIALAAVVGFKLFGSGISGTSVNALMAGTAFVSLFVIASAFSATYIVQIPVFGWIFMFILSAMYTVGTIQQMTGGSGE